MTCYNVSMMVKRGCNPGLSAKIKALRNQLGLTQGQLAAKIGANRSYISLIEIGRVGKPSAVRMLKLAEALRVDVNELYAAAGYKQIRQETDDESRINYSVEVLRRLPREDRENVFIMIEAFDKRQEAKKGKSEQQD